MDVGSVTLALLPSPLLGPAVWRPVAAELVAGGWDVIVPPAYGPVATPQDVLAHLLNSIPATTPVVLVPHSNAGLYAAALAAARDVRGLVFVDAGLPEDDGSTPTAPAELRDFLGDLVGADGRLPPWTRWWAEDEVDELFPDAPTRRAVEDEQASVPLAYFDARIPSPPGWQELPAAYLAFGETYAAERARAVGRHWPVRVLPGDHLHPVVAPAEVAAAIAGLVGRLGHNGPGVDSIRV